MAQSEEQNNESYSANPNQKVYDTPHVVDHLVDVIAIYFAEKKKKYKWTPKEETYTVKSGGKIADVKKKYTDTFKTEKKTIRNLATDPDHTAALKPNDQIKVTWEEQEEDGFEMVKIPKATIGNKVYIVVRCNGDKAKLTVQINENKLANPEAVYDAPVKFLIGDQQKDKVEFSITKDKNEYEQEITLRPKADADLKKLVEKFEKRTDKNAFVYLKGEVTETTDEIKFPDETQEFLNQQQQQFEVLGTPCYCNRDITVDEMIDLIYHLRDKQNYVSKRDHFFNSGGEKITEISISTGKISDNRDKIQLFVNEMNAMFKKFGINTCKRKIHFIGQMYLETISFTYTYESRSSVPSNYKGGVDFQGRGMKQITHDYNYLAYYDYINTTTFSQTYMTTRSGYESVGECVANRPAANTAGLDTAFYDGLKTFAKKISQELFHAFNSAGWFSTVYKPTTLAEMDKGLENENIRLVTVAINGGETNLAERQNYTKWAKEFFKYDTECVRR